MSRIQTDVLRQHLAKLQAWQNRNLTQEIEMNAAKIALDGTQEDKAQMKAFVDQYAGAYKDAENFGNGQWVTQKELVDLARDQDVIDAIFLRPAVSDTVAAECMADLEAGRQTGYTCQ
jgi:hypothetical protein